MNKSSDHSFKLRTPTCTLLTYLHILGKHELKPDHNIEKSIQFFNYHFLLLPQPFHFYSFLILYEIMKFVFIGMENTVGKGENTCINRMFSFSNDVFKAYLSQPLWFCELRGFQMQAYKMEFPEVINKTRAGFALSIAIVAKCEKKIIVAQDFFIWRKCMATTFLQVTKIQLTYLRQQ